MFLEEGNSPPSPLVNQEQMGSPTTSVPKLNLKQIEQFKELVTRAYNLARTYNGSSLKRDVFLNAVQSLKDFTEPFCSESKFSEAQLLASFAYQSKTVFSDNFSIQNLYDAAFSNFLPYRASQPTDTRRLIQFLSGLRVDIEASSMELYIKSGRENPSNIAFEPRLAVVLQALFDQGYCVEDMTFMIYNTSSPAKLSSEHIIISIPERECQIAVSDLMTRDVYISKGFKSLEYWQSATAAELSGNEDVKVISGLKEKELYQATLSTLPDKENKPESGFNGASHDIEAILGPTKNGGPASLEEIPIRLQAFLEHRKRMGIVPSANTDTLERLFQDVASLDASLIPEDEEGGHKPKRPVPVNAGPRATASEEKPRLELQNPLDYTLAFLRSQRAFPARLRDKTPAKDIWHSWVIDRIKEYRAENNQQNPTRESGPVKGCESIDWAMIDDGIYAAGHGRKIRLERFIEKNSPPVKAVKAKKIEISEKPKSDKGLKPKTERDTATSDEDYKQQIIQDVLVFAETYNKFPNVAIAQNFPDEYSRRMIWRHSNWLARHESKTLSEFIESWIIQKATDFKNAHNDKWPDTQAGQVNGYSITWERIDELLQNKARNKISLALLLESDAPDFEERLRELRSGKKKVLQAKPVAPLTEAFKDESTERKEPIKQVLDHLRENGQWLDKLGSGESTGPLIAGWLASQLRKSVSGPLPKHPDVSWEMVIEAFAAQAQITQPHAVVAAPVTRKKPEHREHIPEIIQSPIEQVVTCLSKNRAFPAKFKDKSDASEVWRSWLVERIKEYRDDHGQENPTPHSGSVKGYEAIDWAMIDDAIFATGRRHRIHLDRFIDKNKATIGIANPKKVRVTHHTQKLVKPQRKTEAPVLVEGSPLSPIEDMLAHVAKHRKFPPTLNDGTQSGEVWRKWVVDRVSEYRKDNRFESPTASSGPIKGFAMDWSTIDDAIYAAGRKIKIHLPRFIEKNWEEITKLEQKETPSLSSDAKQRKSPSSAVPAWNKVIGKIILLVPDFAYAARTSGKQKMVREKYDQTIDTPTDLDAVVNRILDFAAEHKAFPNKNDTSLTPRQKAFWNEQERWLLVTQNMSLSKFIQSWTRQAAQDYREKHDGLQPSEFSGAIDGHEKYDWRLLKDCFFRDSHKPAFEQIISLDTHGNLVKLNEASVATVLDRS